MIQLVQKNLKRLEKYNSTYGGYDYGEDNNLAELISDLISLSPTAWQSFNLYRQFLAGSGFDPNPILKSNVFSTTLNDLLSAVCIEMAKYKGVFIHIGYNLNMEVSRFKVLPFGSCRIGKKDWAQYHNKILYREDGFERRGTPIKFDVFNPDKNTIKEQIRVSGGFDKWKGQILFYSLDQGGIYPTSPLFPVLYFAEVEHELSKYYLSTTKRGFKDIAFLTINDGQIKESDLIDKLKEVTGVEHASSSIVASGGDLTNDKDPISIQTLPDSSAPDKFKHFEMVCQNQIRKAFGNIPPQMIDYISGKLGGTTGQDLSMAQSIYNANTHADRKKISSLFQVLFKYYKNPIDIGEIKQIKLYDDGTAD